MALREGRVALLAAIQPPTEHTIADDQVEMVFRKVALELLERRDDMLPRAETSRIRVGLDRPEVLVRKVQPLILGSVHSTTDEQYPGDSGVLRVLRKDDLLQDDTVGGVECHG